MLRKGSQNTDCCFCPVDELCEVITKKRSEVRLCVCREEERERKRGREEERKREQHGLGQAHLSLSGQCEGKEKRRLLLFAASSGERVRVLAA